MSDRPLVSFILLAYNQEQFIREAVVGALSQTYSPLEIIISDDCSTDRTFEKIKEIVKSYEGPHNIILNQNEKNMGLGRHFNALVQMSNGEYIISAAGDDISLPQRTSTMVEIFNTNINIQAIVSEVNHIDQNGEDIGALSNSFCVFTEKLYGILDLLQGVKVPITGCSMAWKKSLWQFFGPFLVSYPAEDYQIRFWALLSGYIYGTKIITVKYRHHSHNISMIMHLTRMPNIHITGKLFKNVKYAYQENFIDRELFGKIRQHLLKSLKNRILIDRFQRSNKYKICLLISPYFTLKEKIMYLRMAISIIVKSILARLTGKR